MGATGARIVRLPDLRCSVGSGEIVSMFTGKTQLRAQTMMLAPRRKLARRQLFGLAAGACAVLATSNCLAAEGTEAVSAPGGLAVVDWLIVAAYAAATIGMGWYFSRRQETTEEYFVGSGRMNPFLIGVSLFATLLSTISYLSMPGEALGKGPVHLTTLLAYPLVFLIVGYVLIPVYMRQRVTSAYALLEENLGLSVRMLGAVMFVTLRLVWMSLLVYLTAKAMTIMLGVPPERQADWIPWIVLVTGFVAVTYTSMGGMRAVVVTDFMQTLLLYGGALLVIGVITWDMGGFGWFPTEWQPNWDTQPVFSWDPQTRVTVVGSITSFFLWTICTAGGDQVSVQRFMSVRDAGAARWAYGTQCAVSSLVVLTLGLVGFALLGYYQAHPEFLPSGMGLRSNADDLFPQFIAYHLPPGISGLVVSAMFAAAMSSIDSGVNSITAVVMTDFLDRFGRRPKNERQHVLAARVLAFGIGAAVVIGSSFMDRVPGNITAVTGKTSNLLTTPIFCLFFFALFVPFARPAGVWAGAIVGTTVAAVVAFSGPLVILLHTHFGVDPATFNVAITSSIDPQSGLQVLSCPDPISFQWIPLAAVVANTGVGSLVSLLLRPPAQSGSE
jgi:solute:Na+ symporter, SSS family